MFTEIKMYAMAAALLVAVLTAVVITHKVDLAKYDQLLLNYANANTKVVEKAKVEQAAEDQIALNAAVTDATNQQKIITQTVTVQKETVKYVKDKSDCITYGLVRLLDASANGVDPATLALPTGKSDAACAPVSWAALADSIIGNYGIARQNAEQLTNLQSFVGQVAAQSNKQ